MKKNQKLCRFGEIVKTPTMDTLTKLRIAINDIKETFHGGLCSYVGELDIPYDQIDVLQEWLMAHAESKANAWGMGRVGQLKGVDRSHAFYLYKPNDWTNRKKWLTRQINNLKKQRS